MAKSDIGIGVDVGTGKAVVAVGQIKDNVINIVGLGKATNSGMRKGVVSDIEEVISAVSTAAEEAERMAGFPLASATLGIGGGQVQAVESKGVIAVSRADGEITDVDVNRAIDSTKNIPLPPNQEILEVIPQLYIVDGQTETNDPTGMSGIRLETKSLIISGPSVAIKNLVKCVNQAGLEVIDMVFTPLTTAEILLTKKQKELGTAMIDIGSGTTSLTVFEEGKLIHTAILPIGSLHLTNDIAIGLRIGIEAAEKVKLKYTSARSDDINENDQIDLSKLDPNNKEKVSRKYVSEIVEARLSEIFNLLRDELKKIGKDGMLPGGVVLTGGGSQLNNLTEMVKKDLRLPAQIGLPAIEVSGIVDKLDDPVYTAAIGIMMASLKEKREGKWSKGLTSWGNLDRLSDGWRRPIGQVKNIFKHFLP